MPHDAVQDFYRDYPRMVSSPFGGVDGIQADLLLSVLKQLGFALPGKRVLDIGCGRGFTREVVLAEGGHWVGLDFVISRTGISLVCGDAQRLPFPDATFDILFCIDAFEHFSNPLTAAREFCRVLRPGGEVFLSVPNYANIAGIVKRLVEGVGWQRRDTWAPFGRWQPQEREQFVTSRMIRRVFCGAGFAAFHRIGYAREVGLGLFPWLDHPSMPEAVRLRLQRLFRSAGRPLAAVWPSSSLHLFWRIGKAPAPPSR